VQHLSSISDIYRGAYSCSKVDFDFFTFASVLLGLHFLCFLFHLIELFDIRVIIDACFRANPLSNSVDASRLDKLVVASACTLELAGDDVVSLVSAQALLLAELLG